MNVAEHDHLPKRIFLIMVHRPNQLFLRIVRFARIARGMVLVTLAFLTVGPFCAASERRSIWNFLDLRFKALVSLVALIGRRAIDVKIWCLRGGQLCEISNACRFRYLCSFPFLPMLRFSSNWLPHPCFLRRSHWRGPILSRSPRPRVTPSCWPMSGVSSLSQTAFPPFWIAP